MGLQPAPQPGQQPAPPSAPSAPPSGQLPGVPPQQPAQPPAPSAPAPGTSVNAPSAQPPATPGDPGSQLAPPAGPEDAGNPDGLSEFEKIFGKNPIAPGDQYPAAPAAAPAAPAPGDLPPADPRANDWKAAKEAARVAGYGEAENKYKAEIDRLNGIVEQTNFRRSALYHDKVAAPRKALSDRLADLQEVEGVEALRAQIENNQLTIGNAAVPPGLDGYQADFVRDTIKDALALRTAEQSLIEQHENDPNALRVANTSYEETIRQQVEDQNKTGLMTNIQAIARQVMSDPNMGYTQDHFARVLEKVSDQTPLVDSVEYLASAAVVQPWMVERMTQMQTELKMARDQIEGYKGKFGALGSSSPAPGAAPHAPAPQQQGVPGSAAAAGFPGTTLTERMAHFREQALGQIPQ